MKKIVILVMSVLLLFSFAGCQRKKEENKDTDNYEVNLNIDKNIKADISILIPSGNENEKLMVEKAIDGFNIIYPNVKFRLSYIAVNSYENTIRNKAMAGSLDDILWTNSPDFYYLVGKKLALNLNPYIKASEEAKVFNLEQDFYKTFFDIGSVKGKLYAVPRSVDSVVTFYNKEILQASGVDMESVVNGWTWDTFMEACAKVRAYYDSQGWKDRYVLDANLSSWLSVCYPMLKSFGADVADENGKIIIDSANTRECIEVVKDLVAKRYICDSTQSSGSSFEAGTGAFLFQSASVSLFANRKNLKGKMDIVSFPLINKYNTPKIGCGIAGYSINADTKNKDVCWAFINYMMSKEGQQEMALGGLNLPSIRKDLADYKTANWGLGFTDLNLSAYLYGMEYKVTPEFLSRFDPKFKTDLDQSIKDLFNNATNGKKTVDQCMTTVIRDINNALDK